MQNSKTVSGIKALFATAVLTSLFMICGCGGESAESLKLKALAPSLHSKLINSSTADLEQFLAEISANAPEDGILEHLTPSGEVTKVKFSLLRPFIKQKLEQ